MVAFIAMAIEKARKTGLEAGQAKYRAYFISTARYAEFKADVDEILTIDGYADCIVTA